MRKSQGSVGFLVGVTSQPLPIHGPVLYLSHTVDCKQPTNTTITRTPKHVYLIYKILSYNVLRFSPGDQNRIYNVKATYIHHGFVAMQNHGGKSGGNIYPFTGLS
jgi:hypothetical protein